MKKFLIGLLFFGIFAGFSSTYAWSENCEEERGTPFESECLHDLEGNTILEKAFVVPGKFSREVEEFNLRVEYYSRPYEEKDLSFRDWLDLHGHTALGAGPIPNGSLSLPDAREFGEVGSNVNLRSFLLNVTNWVLTFLGIICIIMIIYAGYVYIITGGEDGHEKGKKIIMYVAVGIIVILVSYALVNTIIKKTIEGGENYTAISLSRDAVTGSLSITNSTTYGQIVLLDSGAAATLTAEAPVPTGTSTYANPTDLQWNFGDGSIVMSQPGQNTIDRTFFDEGFKEVIVIGKIEETDSNGNTMEHDYMARQKILVGSNLVANFIVNPASPKVDDNVHFNAQSSQALVGSIDNYSWSCSPASLCGNFQNSNNNELDVVFDTAGMVTITLEISSSNPAGSATYSKTFEVRNLPTSASLRAQITASPTSPMLNSSVHFQGRALPAGTVPDNFTWECQAMGTTNVNICTDFNANASGNMDFYAIFAEEGNAKITLTVEKNGVVSPSAEKIIHVITSNSTQPGNASNVSLNMPSAARVATPVSFSASTTNQNSASFRWTFPNGTQTGDTVTNTFDDTGDKNVNLEVLDNSGNTLETLSKKVVVVEQGKPIPGLKINGQNIFQGDTINVLVGDNLAFQTDSTDSLGNKGSSAKVTHSWVLNGAVVDESVLSSIPAKIGTYSLKLNAISTLDSNKRSSLQFKIKVARKAPKVNLTVTKSSLGEGFYKMQAQTETEGVPKQYKFEVLENGKVVSTQVVKSSEKKVETIMDVSNRVGDHNYVFQVSETENDGAIAKKSVNKNVTINPTEVVNNPPTVEIFTTPATSGLTSTMFRFYTQADDLDNDFLTYKWEFPNGKKVMGKTVSHRFEKPGQNTVKVTVSDGIDEVEATETIDIEEDPNYMNGNHIPTLLSSGISPGNTGDTNTIFKFYSLAEDSDGDELDYSWVMGDGNRINLQNVSYQYQYPGRYTAKLLISDGLKTVTKAFPIIVVDNGENIPPSTIEDYEAVNDLPTSTGLDSGNIMIDTSLTEQNVAGFMDQLDAVKENIESEEEIKLIDEIDALYAEYQQETDPVKRKELLSQINQKRVELEVMDAKLKFDFVGLEGTTNTRFFFYGKIPESGRPVLIKWDTGDNRSFIGQNVSWKYAKPGNYVVQMEVSDGVSVATDTINIKIK